MDPTTPAPAAPAPAAPPAAPPTPPPTPPAAAPEGEALSLTTTQLSERMARHTRSQLKALFGTDDSEQIKARLAAAEAAEAAAAEAKRAQLSEAERLRADLAASDARAKALEEERDAREFDAAVARACAQLGIRNTDYAAFALASAVNAAPKDTTVDPIEVLKAKLVDPSQRAALGFAAEVATGATTTPSPDGAAPAAPPAGPSAPAKPDSFALDAAAWRIKRSTLGI